MVFGLVIDIILILPLLGAVAFLWVRQKRRRPYPACGRCRYDVTGSIGSVTRCPECGIAFAEGGIVPPRRVSRTLVVMTLLVPLLFATVVAVGVAHQIVARRELAARMAVMRAQSQAALAAQASTATATDGEATDDGEPDAP